MFEAEINLPDETDKFSKSAIPENLNKKAQTLENLNRLLKGGRKVIFGFESKIF